MHAWRSRAVLFRISVVCAFDIGAVLDEMATISAVLYANTNHPELKVELPNWSDRSKQILKKWRALPTEKKAPYLQKARDNRSALRMKKVQHVSTGSKICFFCYHSNLFSLYFVRDVYSDFKKLYVWLKPFNAKIYRVLMPILRNPIEYGSISLYHFIHMSLFADSYLLTIIPLV